MDYEQKYKEALELARDYYKANSKLNKADENVILEDIFPELAESEDEKIRKWIINEIKIKHHNLDEDNVDFVDKAIAWLEKQGESYTKRDVDDAYLEGMAFAKDELEKQNKQILANSAKTCKDEQQPTDNEMKELLHTEYEKGRADAIAEMQVAWSEEDECYMSECIGAIATKDGWSFEEKRKTKHWLKSLKERIKKVKL